MTNLPPIEIAAKPPKKRSREQIESGELDIFAITLRVHRENHNILGRCERLLQLSNKGKKTVFAGNRGYTDNAELYDEARRKRLLTGVGRL